MKKVISGKELYDKKLEAINMLCNTVKTTLGPQGSNVIINNSAFSPFITNDGVTIAQNIESDDPIVNSILELAKESAIKTNEVVGDGTTTTLVLLQGIFNYGSELINKGINPIIIKKFLNQAMNETIKKIKNYSKKPNQQDLEFIATISGGSTQVGKLVSQAYCVVNNKSAIEIQEVDDMESMVIFNKGYYFDTNIATDYFFEDKQIIEFKNSYVLIINEYLNDIKKIEHILNEIMRINSSLVIIAQDYTDEVIQNLLSFYLERQINVCLLKMPEYGIRSQDIIKDIKAITNASIITDLAKIAFNSLGKASLKITKDKTIINFTENKLTKKRLEELNKNLQNDLDDYDKEFINKRIAMFQNGNAIIKVGGATISERREKTMRFEDALNAVSAASEGILPGSGIVLKKISEEIKEDNVGFKILKKALLLPFEQILYNAGIDDSLKKEIANSGFQKIFNINKNKLEDITTTSVVDPTNVVINSLINAVSIASMLLTTTSLVINEHVITKNFEQL